MDLASVSSKVLRAPNLSEGLVYDAPRPQTTQMFAGLEKDEKAAPV